MSDANRRLRQLRRAIGENIFRYRRDRRMPQSDLAEMAHIRRYKLDHYELGRYDIGLSELFQIASALDIELAELVTPPT